MQQDPTGGQLLPEAGQQHLQEPGHQVSEP